APAGHIEDAAAGLHSRQLDNALADVGGAGVDEVRPLLPPRGCRVPLVALSLSELGRFRRLRIHLSLRFVRVRAILENLHSAPARAVIGRLRSARRVGMASA